MKTLRQRGTVAVELAVILSATIVLLPAVALFAMVFFQYSVMKDATRDAALYLASMPPAALIDPVERNRAIGVAQRMVEEAALAAGMTGLTRVQPASVTCNGSPCDDVLPTSVEVLSSFTIEDLSFSYYTGSWTDDGQHKWRVMSRSTMPLSRK